MFGKKRSDQNSSDSPAMQITTDGKTRNVSFKELLLSTNMTLEALMSVLIKKGVITPDELLDEIESRRERAKADD